MALVNVPHLDVHQLVQETLTSLGPGIVYSRLLRLRTGAEDELSQPSLQLECELCEWWEVVDPLSYRFELRKGVLWQDISPVKGRELVADDLVFSYERLRTPGWDNAALFQNIREVSAEGTHTLNITINPEFPDADFMLALADGHAKVVAKEAVEQGNGHLKIGPVIGSGPWLWKSTTNDVGSVFEKNPQYFETGLPFLDELVISIIRGTDETRLAAFVTGQIDVYRIPPKSWRQLQDTRMGDFSSYLSKQSGSGMVLTINSSAPPFDNLQVRRAVLKALDPWNDVRSIWEGQGFVSLGVPVLSSDWLLSRDEMRKGYFADPTVAEALLAESGLSMPIPFELDVADFGDTYLEQGRKVESDLRSVGFAPTFKRLGRLEYGDKIWRDKEYQLALGQLPPSFSTNSFLFATLFGLSARGNVIRHSDTRLDDLTLSQAVERDSAKRKEIVQQIQRHLLEQAYMFSPVTGAARWALSPRVKGFYPNTAASEYFYWAETWLE